MHLLVKDLDRTSLTNLASNPKTPLDILKRLAKNRYGSVRYKVAENINTPINILSELVEDSEERTVLSSIRNIAIKTNKYDTFLSEYYLSKYMKNLSQGEENIYYIPEDYLEKIIHKNPSFVAGYPNTPENLLLELSQHTNSDIRQKVAENNNTPVHILEKLAYDENSSVLCSVATNPNTPLKILFKEPIRNTEVSSAIAYQLSSQKSESSEKAKIHDILAEESASSLAKILRHLIDEGGIQARIFLGSRADLPVNLLMQLAQKTEPEVQEAVAKNPNTPTSSLEKLANNQKAEVRQAVARHPKTPSEILAILADDDSPIVRASAMSNPNLGKESIEQILCGKYAAEYPQYNPDFLKNNPDSLALVLNYYAKSQFQLVSYIALLQPQVSQQILEEKSLSVSWLNRFAVAQNINTSSEILQKLAEDSNQLVRAAAKNKLLSK